MNLQQILEPIGEAIVWSFDNLLVPMGNLPNIVCTLGVFVGIFIWVKMQKKYNEEAERNGTLK